MSECTERSEGRERTPKAGTGVSECTERSEGRERAPKAGTA
ncbi:MAG: hypothetical protein QOH97_4330 [Actinoplanes sp.]|jgi:hypothetical protein|nr:hypothetical protein [Actinoplanes sp.]